MCINPIQSLQSPLLVPLWALSPRSWGSGHTWCSWTLRRFAWQRLWCRSPQPRAQCSRRRKRRPDRRWHTENTECWKGVKEKRKQAKFRIWKNWQFWIATTACKIQKDLCKYSNSTLTCRQGWCSPEDYGQSKSRWVSLSLWVPGVHIHKRGQCQRSTAVWRPGSSMAPHPNSACSSHSNLLIRTHHCKTQR